MAKTDVLVRMKADTSGYDANIAKARKQLERFGQDNLSAGGVLKQLSGQLLGAAAKFASFGAAATAAMKVAKDAFMSSERYVDEWGRTVASVQGVYQGFLNSINNGDISGYLSRIDEIVTAARKAYDELDRLGTLKTIQTPAMSRQEAENTRIRTMLMTGRWISAGDGRKSPLGLKDGDLLTPAQLKTLERQLQNGMQKIVTLTKNEVKQTGKAVDAYYETIARQSGMSYSEFRKGVSNMDEFDKRVKGANNYAKWQDDHSYVDVKTGELIRPRTGNPYAQYAGWDNFRIDKQGKNSYNELVSLIRQQDQQTSQLYSTIGQAYRTVNRAEGITVKSLMSGGAVTKGGATGGGGTTTTETYIPVEGSIDAQTAKVQELEKAWRAAADDDSRQRIKKEIEEAQFALDILLGKTSGIPEMNYGVGDLAGKKGSGLFQQPLFQEEKFDKKNPWKLDENAIKSVSEYYSRKTAKTEVNLTKEMGDIANGISGILGGIEGLGIELPQGLKDAVSGIQSVISILSSIATIITAIQALTAADTIIPFASGGVVRAAGGFSGIVPGTQFSGDNIPALLDAGEVVLNRAQSGVIASALQNGGGSRGYTPSYVSGEQIWIALNNFTKRTGRGEIITWR